MIAYAAKSRRHPQQPSTQRPHGPQVRTPNLRCGQGSGAYDWSITVSASTGHAGDRYDAFVCSDG